MTEECDAELIYVTAETRRLHITFLPAALCLFLLSVFVFVFSSYTM